MVGETAVQPLAAIEQAPSLVLEKQDIVPPVQAFVQQDAEPAVPLQAPLVQVVVVVTVVQPLAPRTQVLRLVFEKHVVPTVQALVQQDAEPSAPEHAPLTQVAPDAL